MEELTKYEFWSRLTFKTKSFRKNFDLTFQNENFITEHEGTIGEVRYDREKPPFIVGEFGFTIWNLGFAHQFDVNLYDSLSEYKNENTYDELINLIWNKSFSLDGINKLILIHTLVIHPDYRKRNVVDEFIEFMYRDFQFGSSNVMVALVKPIQRNMIDWDFFRHKKKMRIREITGPDAPYEEMSAAKYYNLYQFDNSDPEIIEYKLFAIANRCGFQRLGDSHLFEFHPNKILERLKQKRMEYNKTLL